eukprot:12891746-Prorocentrum_lima.AAC.1
MRVQSNLVRAGLRGGFSCRGLCSQFNVCMHSCCHFAPHACGRMNFKLRPTFHYFDHTVEQVRETDLNPRV